MPIYAYKCRVCGNEFEELQSIADEPVSECPCCHVMCSNRLIGPTTFVLKGSRWAKDGYTNNKRE